jgi:hypothetical protein
MRTGSEDSRSLLVHAAWPTSLRHRQHSGIMCLKTFDRANSADAAFSQTCETKDARSAHPKLAMHAASQCSRSACEAESPNRRKVESLFGRVLGTSQERHGYGRGIRRLRQLLDTTPRSVARAAARLPVRSEARGARVQGRGGARVRQGGREVRAAWQAPRGPAARAVAGKQAVDRPSRITTQRRRRRVVTASRCSIACLQWSRGIICRFCGH